MVLAAQMVADDTPGAARKNVCIYPKGDQVKYFFDYRRIPLAKEPLGNIARQNVIEIRCTKRSTPVLVVRDRPSTSEAKEAGHTFENINV